MQVSLYQFSKEIVRNPRRPHDVMGSCITARPHRTSHPQCIAQHGLISMHSVAAVLCHGEIIKGCLCSKNSLTASWTTPTSHLLVPPLDSAFCGYAGEVTRPNTMSLRIGGVEDNTMTRGDDELGEERFKEVEGEDGLIFSISGSEASPSMSFNHRDRWLPPFSIQGRLRY